MAMILHRVLPQACVILTSCHAQIHTTNTLSSFRSPRKRWQEFVKNWEQKVDDLADRAKKDREKQKTRFEKVNQESSDSTKDSAKDPFENLRGSKALHYLPTVTAFNARFDKLFRRLPSGQDLISKVNKEYHPYLYLSRVDKPIGSWLLFLPGAWSICMASPAFHGPSLPLLLLFGVGAVLMRGAGCTINDIYDVDIDRRVIRTHNRPIANGTLTQSQAVTWLGLQLGISACILLSMNSLTVLLGVSSLLLVGVYPLMKRITDYPQFFLGLTFNYGALMGYTAYTGTLGFTPLALYMAGICWTMIYDTIYAHQDKKDDILIGVRSTALKFGDKTLEKCSMFTSMMGIALCAAGFASGMGPIYWVISFSSCAMILRGLSLVDLDNADSCWEFFCMNRNIGLLLLLGIILGKFI